MSDAATLQRPALRFASWATSHVGRVRKLNEDSFLDRQEIGLWCVADGMGGHEAGNLASGAIVEALRRVQPPVSGAAFAADVRARVGEAHEQILAEARRRGPDTIIGSTVVVLMVLRDRYACFWAGDSRLYLLRDRQLWQITRDHTHVQDLIDSGRLAEDQAKSHPQRNVITRAVGLDPLELETAADRVLEGDVFLLCSDGVTGTASDPEIAGVLAGDDPQMMPARLIALALDRGAPDNTTAVVVKAG